MRQLRSLSANGATAAGWSSEWRRRCPRTDGGALADLDRILLRQPAAGAAPATGNMARRALRRAVVLLFRRATLEPATAFCYLTVVSLDLQRLRGELVRSLVFGAREAAA